MESNFKDIQSLLEKEEWDKVLAFLNAYPETMENAHFLRMRAMVFQKLGRFSDSINDYNSLLKIFPDDKEILSAKIMLEQILSMSRLDVFECTNTHLDPWD